MTKGQQEGHAGDNWRSFNIKLRTGPPEWVPGRLKNPHC